MSTRGCRAPTGACANGTFHRSQVGLCRRRGCRAPTGACAKGTCHRSQVGLCRRRGCRAPTGACAKGTCHRSQVGLCRRGGAAPRRAHVPTAHSIVARGVAREASGTPGSNAPIRCPEGTLHIDHSSAHLSPRSRTTGTWRKDQVVRAESEADASPGCDSVHCWSPKCGPIRKRAQPVVQPRRKAAAEPPVHARPSGTPEGATDGSRGRSPSNPNHPRLAGPLVSNPNQPPLAGPLVSNPNQPRLARPLALQPEPPSAREAARPPTRTSSFPPNHSSALHSSAPTAHATPLRPGVGWAMRHSHFLSRPRPAGCCCAPPIR